MKTTAVALSLTLAAGAARAQSTGWDSCTDSTQSAPYSRCALSLLGGQLTRGHGELLAIDDPESPIALSRYVRGGPARRYALRYERETKAGLVLRFAGAALVFGEAIGGRELRDGKASRTERRNVITGFGLVVFSRPFRWWALRDGLRAVEAHNAGLAH